MKLKDNEVDSLKERVNDLENKVNEESINKTNINTILGPTSDLIKKTVVTALAPVIAQQNAIEKNTNEQFEAFEKQLLPLLEILRSKHKLPD